MQALTPAALAATIDHTLLRPDATRAEIEKLCAEAKEHRFASVCVNPYWIGLVAKLLEGTGVAPCCVVGFPLGALPAAVKAAEAKACVALGAREVDMVLNVGAAKDGDWATVESDIRAVAEAVHPTAKLKVILETCLLSDEEKIEACKASVRAGSDFVKTSTGFSKGGATAHDVALMREIVGPDIGVKASGGVRTREDALAMLEAGASRLGASAGIAIIGG